MHTYNSWIKAGNANTWKSLNYKHAKIQCEIYVNPQTAYLFIIMSLKI